MFAIMGTVLTLFFFSGFSPSGTDAYSDILSGVLSFFFKVFRPGAFSLSYLLMSKLFTGVFFSLFYRSLMFVIEDLANLFWVPDLAVVRLLFEVGDPRTTPA